MSNPIKSLLSTPLSMQFISDFNTLNKIPLPLYKFFIDCAFSLKISTITATDQSLFKNILQRQKVPRQFVLGAINSVKLLENVNQRVLKLMRTSQPAELEGNLENCQKYLANVFAENTLLLEDKISYLLQKLASTVHKSLESNPKTIQTKFGAVQWSVYNLKKANLNNSIQSSSKNQSENDQSTSSLKTLNKMYVKASFGQNFCQSQIQKLIGSAFEPNPDSIIEAKLQQAGSRNKSIKIHSKTVTMSLIDFRLFMDELEKVKNINY